MHLCELQLERIKLLILACIIGDLEQWLSLYELCHLPRNYIMVCIFYMMHKSMCNVLEWNMPAKQIISKTFAFFH